MASETRYKGETAILAIVLLVAILLAAGCETTTLERRAAHEPAYDTQGPSWHSVFHGPSTVGAIAATDPRGFPEYSRNDAALNVRPETPVLASNEWPERERASLAYPRTIFINPDASQFIFFENESRYRTGYRAGYAPVSGGSGYWGFWR